MFRLMYRPLIKPLVHALVAAQLLLSAPVASALGSNDSVAHCAEMVTVDDTQPCPCCPEGADMASCQASCAVTPGAVQTLSLQRVPATIARLASESVLHLTHLADPPLKPPPIV